MYKLQQCCSCTMSALTGAKWHVHWLWATSLATSSDALLSNLRTTGVQ